MRAALCIFLLAGSVFAQDTFEMNELRRDFESLKLQMGEMQDTLTAIVRQQNDDDWRAPDAKSPPDDLTIPLIVPP